MRLIDADEFISELQKLYDYARWDQREVHFSLADIICNIEMIPTIVNRKPMERTCYNCKHGAFGFDSDLGCSLWHRGKLDAKNCQFWEGAKEE